MSHAGKEIDRQGGVRATELRSSRARSAHGGRNYARVVALFLCAAAVMISSVALVQGNATDDRGEALVRQPPETPYMVQGYVYLSDGVTECGDFVANITNTRTGAWNLTNEYLTGFGWYEFDLKLQDGGVLDGDLINITVTTPDLQIGWAEGVAEPTTTGVLWVNVVLSGTVIPEFPLAVIPVVGIVAAFVVVSLQRRKDRAV